MFGFGYTLLDTPEKIQKYITNNRKLQQTKFYVGKTPAVTMSRTGNSFIANGFLAKNTELRISSAVIAASNRMRLIEIKAAGRKCWLPLNRIGIKSFTNISFRKTNDTFIDSLNADIQYFQRNGIQAKLYVNSISPANLIYDIAVKGNVSKNKKSACQYYIEGFSSGIAAFPSSFFIRVIETAIDIPSNDRYSAEIIKYLTHFIDSDKNLTTNVAYIFPNGTDYGVPLYGKGYVGRSGAGSPDCADVVFYGAPSVDTDEMTGSIILKPNIPSSASTVTYVLRRGIQPPSEVFCYLASMKQGKNITRPKRINNAILQMTFTKHIENNPNVVKKGTTIGIIPPGAASGV